MMEHFENFIRKHRRSFDDHHLDTERLWSKIEQSLHEKEVKKISYWRNPSYQIAASFLLLIGILISGFLIYDIKREGPFIAAPMEQELTKINLHYTATINHYRKRLEQHPGLSRNDKEDFLRFLNRLDLEYNELEAELQNNVNNERVLEALVQNQKIRIELIENFLSQIKRSTKEKENYEGYSL